MVAAADRRWKLTYLIASLPVFITLEQERSGATYYELLNLLPVQFNVFRIDNSFDSLAYPPVKIDSINDNMPKHYCSTINNNTYYFVECRIPHRRSLNDNHLH